MRSRFPYCELVWDLLRDLRRGGLREWFFNSKTTVLWTVVRRIGIRRDKDYDHDRSRESGAPAVNETTIELKYGGEGGMRTLVGGFQDLKTVQQTRGCALALW